MRRLTPQQKQMLDEWDKEMEATKRAHERWDREKKGKPGRSPNPPARPASAPSRRPTPALVAAARVGYADGSPHLVCRICLEPAHLVARTGLCQQCASEARWRVGLAVRGFRVVVS